MSGEDHSTPSGGTGNIRSDGGPVPASQEQQLIERVLDGEMAAFPALVQPYLQLFTAGVHRILQEDQFTRLALEEALVRIHAELPCFKGRGRFSTWAYHICLSEALSLRRSTAKAASL